MVPESTRTPSSGSATDSPFSSWAGSSERAVASIARRSTPIADPAATLVFVVGYVSFELYAGFSSVALALCVSLVIALSFAAAVRSRGG